MNLCTETITVFNKVLNPETRLHEFKRSVIKGVSYHGTLQSYVINTGLSTTNHYNFRIPIEADFNGKEYVLPSKYTGKDSEFTFFEGDIVAIGEVTTPDESDFTMVILGVVDNTRLPNAKHWRLICK